LAAWGVALGFLGGGRGERTIPPGLPQQDAVEDRRHRPDPILGKKYVVTVLVSLPARAKSYHYKPMLSLQLGASGPRGCGDAMSAIGRATTVKLLARQGKAER
jgi:hypothetical protein